MNYTLPTSLSIGGKDYKIRSDYRVALDICEMLNDPELTQQEKGGLTIFMLYEDYESIPQVLLEEALKQAFYFIDGGTERPDQKKPKLVDWAQDFVYIVAPINSQIGMDVRAIKYMHWWTFISYYMEINGNSTFSQIVNIRNKLKRGKMDKSDKEWYRKNRDLVDFKVSYTETEDELLKQWGAK